MIGKISLILQWLPRVVAVVMLTEELLRVGTPGSEKKAKAMEFLARQGLPEKYVNVIGSVVDLVVDIMHATGLLKRVKKETVDVIVPEDALNPAVREVADTKFDDAYRALLADRE